jgi:hypothetical protein
LLRAWVQLSRRKLSPNRSIAECHAAPHRQFSRGTAGSTTRFDFYGDVTLTGNTALYSSRKNLAPSEINDLGYAKTNLSERLRGYTQLM